MRQCFVVAMLVTFVTSAALAAPADDAKPATKPLDPAHAAKMAAGTKLFKSDVRAILIEHCIDCHGGEKTKGELDLNTREKLIEGGFEAAGIVPGEHAKSKLYKAIAHTEKPYMPHKAPKLDDASIEKIARWIDLGAPYNKPLVEKNDDATKPTEMVVTEKDRQFWSFQPLRRVAPPAIQNDDWSRTAIDKFVLAKLRERNLAPNAIADRRTLIRRAYFDLIGLPPTPAEVESFVNDDNPDAYAKLIDRLLDNPHFGERWARHWLDVARFGESDGYEQDYDRPHAYHYRDFVIKAFNRDMPFDQFVAWQLAGDEIAPNDPLAMMATGFLTAGTFPTQLTEREFEQARYDQLDDMTNTTTIAFLGLAVGCARCHDHKFDPIPARDYYELVSTFTTTIRSDIELDLSTPAERSAAEAKHQTELAKLEEQLARFEETELPALFAKFVETYGKDVQATGPWAVLDIKEWKTINGTKFEKQADGSLLKTGDTPATDTYTLIAETESRAVTGLRIEALTHKSLPRNGPGLAGNGNFCLSDITVTASPRKGGGEPVAVKLVEPRATHQQNTSSLSLASSLDGDKVNSGWAVDAGGIGKDQAAAFAFEKPVDFEGGATFTVTLVFNHTNTQHAIGRPRLAVTTGDARKVAITGDSAKEPQPPAEVARTLEQLARREGEPSAGAKRAASQWFATTLPQFQALKKQLDDKRKAGPAIKKVKVQVSSEGLPKVKHHADGRGFPHFYPKTHLLNRGDPNQKQEVVSQDFLQVLMPAEAAPDRWQVEPPKDWRTSYRRRSLANWLTDAERGAGRLLARVIVNRLWLHHIGRGIVATPNDFGFQGSRPTHPELLDYLATQLIESDWRLKPIHKLIMQSAVYMQTVDYHSDRAAGDPENRYYWRRDLRRLEAEIIRDSMLAVSGQLDDRMFGPGTLDESMKRRSIYFFLKRSRIVPVLQIFDMPEPLVSQGSRPTTTIAPQALLFMNNPQVQSYARGFAQRLQPAAEKSLEDAVTQAYQLALGRAPSEKELKENAAFIGEQVASYESQNKANPRELALADFCQVMLCLNEFIYVE